MSNIGLLLIVVNDEHSCYNKLLLIDRKKVHYRGDIDIIANGFPIVCTGEGSLI